MGVTYELLHEESGEYIELGKTINDKQWKERRSSFQGLVALDTPEGEHYVHPGEVIMRFLAYHAHGSNQTFRLLADCEESALDWGERMGVEVTEVSGKYFELGHK